MRFSNVDFSFEVTPKKEIVGRFKNMRSFCATLYIPVEDYWKNDIWDRLFVCSNLIFCDISILLFFMTSVFCFVQFPLYYQLCRYYYS